MFGRKLSVTEWDELLLKIAKNDESVHIVNLSSCQINDERLLALARVLLKNKSVTTLVLAGNNITDIGARVLIKLLSRNDYLQHIDLSFTMISMEHLSRIKYMTEMNQIYVDTLNYPTYSSKLMRGSNDMPENQLMRASQRHRNSP